MIEQREDRARSAKRSARRAVLTIVAMCALALAAAFGLIVQAQRPVLVGAISINTKTERVLIAIEGMHCGGCANGIKAILKRTTGVIAADVSYEHKEAVVDYDPSRVTQEKIVEAISNMGYQASLKR